MGFLDRFKKKAESIGKQKKPKHVVSKGKPDADEEKRRQFAAVPAAGAKRDSGAPVGRQPKDSQGSRAKPTRAKKEDTGEAYRILQRAVISEKSTMLSSQSQYVFAVAGEANKIDVRRAVRSLYGVEPQKVNIRRVRGKLLRYGRSEGRTKSWKKAIVTLQRGQSLDIHGT